MSSRTAGVTGKGGIWRTKPPDAESAVGLNPESVGESPHLSAARGVSLLFIWKTRFDYEVALDTFREETSR